jgi:hypothetical protein
VSLGGELAFVVLEHPVIPAMRATAEIPVIHFVDLLKSDSSFSLCYVEKSGSL